MKRFVFTSTAGVYKASNQLIPETGEFKSELDPFLDTKLIIERFLKYSSDHYGIESVILRYSNVIGSDYKHNIGQYHKHQNDLIENILTGEQPVVEENVIRDYIAVGDVSIANEKAVDYLFNGGKYNIFNIGSNGNHGYSDMEIVKFFEKLLNKKIEFKNLNNSPLEKSKFLMDSTRAKNVLNFEIKEKNFEEILKSSIEFYKNHPKGEVVEHVGDLDKVKSLLKELGYE